MSTALVTGATGGLGSAICRSLAEAGYDLALHHRDHPDQAAALVEQLAAFGGRVSALSADLSSAAIDEVATGLVDQASALGRLRVAVLNASSQELTPWDELNAQTWDRLYANTLRHTSAVLQACARVMDPADHPVIVVIGSIEGFRPAPAHTGYAVFKAATHQLVAAAATALGAGGIRVVGVAPGLIDRPGLAQDWPDGYQRWSATVPLHRPVTAAEVADTVTFLASPQASGITGITVAVDAGWSAAPGW